VVGVLLLIVSILEATRLRIPSFNETLLRFFGGIHREEELRRPSGILWTLAGCFLTIFLFHDRDIVLAALWYLALGDAAAGIVGRTWGRVRIGSKSLEGSLSCFLVCWWVGTVCLQSSFGSMETLLGALAATLIEILPLPLNDNLWIPMLSGLALTMMRAFGI